MTSYFLNIFSLTEFSSDNDRLKIILHFVCMSFIILKIKSIEKQKYCEGRDDISLMHSFASSALMISVIISACAKAET